jgi:uncharacterized protein (DUF488 family)
LDEHLSPAPKPARNPPEPGGRTLFTIGHSTLSLETLAGVLKGAGVQIVADVRSQPNSRRVPAFDQKNLTTALPKLGLTYHHLQELGARGRKPLRRSPNTGLPKDRRPFADYMQTDTFDRGLLRLLTLAAIGPVAVLCAEADWTRCHRQLLADALTLRGLDIVHLDSAGGRQSHLLTPRLTLSGGKPIYPAPGEQLSLL